MGDLHPLLPEDPERIGVHLLVGRLLEDPAQAVYLGRLPDEDTLRVIRVLEPRPDADPQARERITNELHAAMRVSGAHTARLLEVGWSDDSPTWSANTSRAVRCARRWPPTDRSAETPWNGSRSARSPRSPPYTCPALSTAGSPPTPCSSAPTVLASATSASARPPSPTLDSGPPSTSARGRARRRRRADPGDRPRPGSEPGPGRRARKARGPLRLGRDRRLRGHRAAALRRVARDAAGGPGGPDEHPARAPLPRRHLPGRASGGPSRHQGGHAAAAR